MSTWTFYGLCVLLLVGLVVAEDVPFVFDKDTSCIANYTSAQLEQMHISSPELMGVPPVTTLAGNIIPVVGGGGMNPQETTKMTVDDLRNLFDSRVEPDNTKVRELAKYIAGDHPGDCTIDQVSEIFSYLIAGDNRKHKSGWSYIGPPRGVNNFFYANETIAQSDDKDYVGAGDCGDFAILMSALVESVGGTTRIILASNNTTGGHAYAQVYIGRDDIQNSDTEQIIRQLKQEFDTDKIFTNIDTNTKDVWLNLDWWRDQEGNPHPGGPFFIGDKNIVLYIRENFSKVPIRLTEKTNKPPKIISLTSDKSSPQDAGSAITWTSKAKDPDKNQIFYKFFLNDNPVTSWTKNNTWVWNTNNDDVGDNQIEVQVRDGEYGHALPNGFDDHRSSNFNITSLETRPIAPNVPGEPIPTPPINKTPTLKIESPSNGSVVSTQERMTGVAKNIPADKEGWVIVFTNSTQLYYPQGPIRPDINGDWSLVSNIGSEHDLGKKFDLVLLLADNQAKDKFNAYFRYVTLRGWLGMDKLPDHTEEYHRITVIRGNG